MRTTTTIRTTRYARQGRIARVLMGLCLAAVAVGVLDMLGRF